MAWRFAFWTTTTRACDDASRLFSFRHRSETHSGGSTRHSSSPRRRVVAARRVDASRRRFRRPASCMRAFAGALGRRAVIRARGVDAFDVIQVRRESFMNHS